MNPVSILEQMMYNTVRLETLTGSSGTGFFFSYEFDNTCKMGANILLEDFPAAKLQYQAMEQEERSQYDDYPIMTLWRR